MILFYTSFAVAALALGATLAVKQWRRYELLHGIVPADARDEWPLYMGTQSKEHAAHEFARSGGDIMCFFEGWEARVLYDVASCSYPAGSYGYHCWSQGHRAFNRYFRAGMHVHAVRA